MLMNFSFHSVQKKQGQREKCYVGNRYLFYARRSTVAVAFHLDSVSYFDVTFQQILAHFNVKEKSKVPNEDVAIYLRKSSDNRAKLAVKSWQINALAINNVELFSQGSARRKPRLLNAF